MKKIVALIMCLFMCFSLAACSFSWDEQTSITSASVVYDEKADKYYLELVYDSGDVSRIEVTDLSALRGDSGSKGDKGDNGNGIAEIITKNNGSETEVTIKFTSEEMKDVTFSIPNGEYVSNVQIFEADETHEGPYLVFTFSGSTEPKEISLPRGKDGVGIDNIEFLTSDNDGYAGTLKITLSDGTSKDIPIPAATGISGITRSENDESYELIINYTDGTSETFDFSKPNQWLSGASTPDFSLGRDGDFYFNTNKKVIYKKVNSEWITVMEFVNEQKHRVVFEAEGAMLAKNNVWVGDTVEFEIVHGCYMTEHVPVPRKNADADKYKFIGWYRKKQAEISEGEEYTLSRFTDLTPVCDDIVLYAWWEKIA